jgi:hypothetical protein
MKKIIEDKSVGIVIHGNTTRKLPVYLPLSQASKNIMFFFLSFLFSSTKVREQEGRTGPV